MTDDLAPRGWRNYHRSQRLRQMRADAQADSDDLEITDWWLEESPDEPTQTT